MRVEVQTAGKHAPDRRPEGQQEVSARVQSVVRTATVVFLALLFLSAAIDKIFHYSQFIAALNSYVVVPGHDGRYFAAAVVLAELVAGVGVMVRGVRRVASALMCGMLLVFSVALAVNVYFGVTAGCGCWFTVTLGRPTYSHVAFDVILAALAATLALGSGAPKAPR